MTAATLNQRHKSKHPRPNTQGRNKVLSMFEPSEVAYLTACYNAAGGGEDKQKGQAGGSTDSVSENLTMQWNRKANGEMSTIFKTLKI